jgi:hypothetical protein
MTYTINSQLVVLETIFVTPLRRQVETGNKGGVVPLSSSYVIFDWYGLHRWDIVQTVFYLIAVVQKSDTSFQL